MALTPTPDASVDEIFLNLPFVSGRLRLVQDEVLRRVQNRLDDAIAELNERNGWAGQVTKEIPLPAGYSIAPSVLDDAYLNHILVGVTLESTTQGVGAFRNEVQVAVYTVDQRIASGQQVTVHWERAELIRGVLFPFLTGCVNAEGKRCWRELQPTTLEMLPENWGSEFSGTVCRFVATQAAGNGEVWE